MSRSVSLAFVVILFAAFSAAAQSPDATTPAPPATSADSAKPADDKKPKKVWTNENMPNTSSALSVVGDPKNSSKGKPNQEQHADAQYIANVRKQLEKLQSQMDDTAKQIADLRSFSKGDSSSNASGIELDHKYAREPIEVQIRSLEEKKKGLQAKYDALLDEARKKGVEPGQLR